MSMQLKAQQQPLTSQSQHEELVGELRLIQHQIELLLQGQQQLHVAVSGSFPSAVSGDLPSAEAGVVLVQKEPVVAPFLAVSSNDEEQEAWILEPIVIASKEDPGDPSCLDDQPVHTPHTPSGRRRKDRSGAKRKLAVSYTGFMSNKSSTNRTSLLPLHPEGKFRCVLDCLAVLMLISDSVVVPYTVAWAVPPTEGFMLAYTWVLAIVWTQDIIANFLTSHQSPDEMSKDLRKIARRYALSWFLPDLLVASFDWATLGLHYMSTSSSTRFFLTRAVRFLKISRFVRMVSIMRSGRWTEIEQQLYNIISSAGLSASFMKFIFGLSQLVFLTLWLNHLGACIWYLFVTNIPEVSDTGISWSTDIFVEQELTDSSWSAQPLYFYLQGLYWSLTTMFSGASWRPPTNSAEAVLSMSVVIFGMLFGSSLISSIAEMLLDFRLEHRDRNQKMRNLRLFLQQHHIPAPLSQEVHDQVVRRMNIENRVARKDVVVLNTISTDSRQKLEVELHGPILASIAFLRICDQLDDTFIHDLATRAVAWTYLDAATQLFGHGDDMKAAHCVIGGSLMYTPKEHLLPATNEDHTQLHPFEVGHRTWLCEAALWCQWLALGRAESFTPSELLTLNVEDMVKVLDFHPGVSPVVQDYNRTFCNTVRAVRPILSDLRCNMNLAEDSIICALPQESRINVSQPALDAIILAASSDPDSQRSADELMAEVTSGGCWLSHDPRSSCVLRVVQLVTLRLHNCEGSLVCAKMAEWSGRHQRMVRKRLQLPGKKMQPGELPRQTLKRLLESDFQGVDLQIKEVSEKSNIQERSYKLQTKFVTTEFSAYMQTGCDMRQVGILPAPEAPSTLKPGEHPVSAWQTDLVPIFINNDGGAPKVSVYAWVPEETLQAAQVQEAPASVEIAKSVEWQCSPGEGSPTSADFTVSPVTLSSFEC